MRVLEAAMKSSRLLLWLAVLYLGFWGGAIGVLAKWAFEGLTPLQLIAARLVISCAVFSVILIWRGELGKTMRSFTRDKAYYAFMGLVGVGGGMILGFLGLSMTTAISYDLLFNVSGLLIVVFGSVLYGERIQRRDLCLLAIAFAGTVLVIGRDGSLLQGVFGGNLRGDALCLLAAVGWALYTVVGAKTAKAYSSRSALGNVFGPFLAASCVLVPYVAVFEPVNPAVITWRVGAATATLGVFATALLFVLWFRFAESSNGTSTALVALSENLGGVILPMFLLGETLTALGVVGAVLIVVPLVLHEYFGGTERK
jgi:drug/metabolite transporter (DMT)-like permease